MVCVLDGAVDIEIHEPLATAIAARMDELGLSPTDLVRQTGLTYQGISNVRRGEIRQYQKRTTTPLAAALYWTPGSIEAILAGGEPELIDPPPPVSSPEADADVLRQLEELRQEVHQNHLDLSAHIEKTTRVLELVVDGLGAAAQFQGERLAAQ